MVGVLIRMKLRVLSHSLGGPRAASYAIGALVGLGAGLVTAWMIMLSFSSVSVATTVSAALFAVWTLGWLFGPVLMGGGDETLRPENFTLLPLAPSKLAFGLLGASLVGVPPVATAIGFAGLVVAAVAFGPVAAVVALVAVVLQLAFTVLLSRVVIASLGAVLGSRRGKDLGVLLAALVGLAYLPVRFAIQALAPVLMRNSPGVAGTLRWVPTGWGPAAVEGAATGNWLTVVGAIVALIVVDAVLVLLWSRLLVARMTSVPASGGPTRVGKAGRTARRGILPATPVGAVVSKELHMWWRDARRRALLLTSTLIGLLIPVFSAAGHAASMLPYAALWMVGFSTLQVSNLYGFDGTSVWHTLVTPGAARADVRGRQWAWALIVGPVALLAALVLPGVAGRASAYPWVLGLLPAMLGAGAGFILLLSAYLPYPMPAQKGGSPFSAGGRPGFGRAMTRLGSVLLLLVSALPSLVLLLVGSFTDEPLVQWLALPTGLLTGWLAAWGLGRLTYQRLEERGPELLATVRAPA